MNARSDETVDEHAEGPPFRPKARDVLLALFFVLAWLAPMTAVGLYKSNGSLYPVFLQNLHRCACLFTNSVSHWSTFHIQVQTSDDVGWHELDEAGYFDMPVFGYRTRYHRIMSHAWGKPGEKKRTDALARFIAQRFTELHAERGDDVKLLAVRFVRVQHRTPDLAKETGKFEKPLLTSLAPSRLLFTGEVRFDGKPVETKPRVKQNREQLPRRFQ